jgi:hypothetical protein
MDELTKMLVIAKEAKEGITQAELEDKYHTPKWFWKTALRKCLGKGVIIKDGERNDRSIYKLAEGFRDVKE